MPYLCHLHVSQTRIDEAVDLLLLQMPNFESFGSAKIELSRLPLPHFETATLVALRSPIDESGNGHVICLASANNFRAHRAIERISKAYRIGQLDGSVVDCHANVTLADGTYVYDVRLDAHEMPGDLTPSERLALAYCLSWQERTEKIERNIPYSVLDERLSEVNAATLVEVAEHAAALRKRNPALPQISKEVFRTALWKMGKRRPRKPM